MNEIYEDGGQKIVVKYKQLKPLTDRHAMFEGFEPGKTLLKKGYQYRAGYMRFGCDTWYERDVAVQLRDGVTIYLDIFRPATEEKIPVILNWGPTGKRGRNNMGGVPMNMRKNEISGLQAFESSDPAHWVIHNYAVVNADPRGVYMSEGNVQFFGPQDAQDGYDIIEWLAQQPWCNGSVGMAGNSWYAMVQWNIAAIRPPHLKAIAPWEGHDDLYREEYIRGGIRMDPERSMLGMDRTYGKNKIEDLAQMVIENPLFNAYWESKCPKVENIDIPVYCVASFGSQIHCHGTFDAFRRCGSEKKWLRVNNTVEWPDFYDPENRADLKKFFDRYMKGIDNDWESTPRVRLVVMDCGGEDLVYRPEESFPLERQIFQKLYLDAEKHALQLETSKEGSVEYDAENEGKVSFFYQFPEDTEVTGYIKAKLWVEAKGADDMDLFIRIIDRAADGEVLYHDAITYKYCGTDSKLRVSLRELDNEKSTDSEPYHTFRNPQKLHPGEIVPVEMGFWPTSMLFHKGEILEFVIAGYDYIYDRAMDRPLVQPNNKGVHIIHTGGRYDSYLQIPVIPN